MLVLVLLLVSCALGLGALPPSCDSPVYCHGPLLHTVQMARIFNDSKTFVDMRMKNSLDTTLENFDTLMNNTNKEPSFDQVKEFVNENFETGNELEEWDPPDFNPEPKFLLKIQDANLRDFGKDIVAIWKTLARKVKPDVSENPNQYSLMPLPNGFIVPGGRFKEIYYWDTYWIVRGLLISEMTETVRGIIENFMFLVKKMGHIPNGSRVYYTQRTQPPLLTKMVDQYIKYTDNLEWLKENIGTLEEELLFWMDNRQVKVKSRLITYRMYQYNAPSYGPRPESYREDVLTAANSPNPNETYIELKSAAESGWDFSSRWFFDEKGGNHNNLSGIHITRIIPVDLNSFMYDAFNILAKLYYKIGNLDKAAYWKTEATALKIAINNILWNEEAGIWQDVDLETKKHRNYFYASNIAPMWVNAVDPLHKKRRVEKVVEYLHKEGIDKFQGGTPMSIIESGEQWDAPNAWPPLQAILIEGLENGDSENSQTLARKLAELWVRANYIGFHDTREMFEKYDSNVPGQFGGGGEYTVQAGFGWTNGVILELLEKYGKYLVAP